VKIYRWICKIKREEIINQIFFCYISLNNKFLYILVSDWSRKMEWTSALDTLRTPRTWRRAQSDLIKIPARERNVDVCHPGTGVLPLLLALTISSLASRSVARGDGITSITNANRLRRRRQRAWYLYLRVRSCTPRSHDGGRLSNHFLLLLECKLLRSLLPRPSRSHRYERVTL